MLRPVTGDAELRQVDQLLQIAYQSPTRERELALYPAAQPDGLFAVFDTGEPVAAAGAFAYGAFCWLGLVGTHPGYAGQGLATRLSEHILDWSREHGCVSVALDASDKGRPVYERLGFQPAGEAVELVADAGRPGQQPGRPQPPRGRPGGTRGPARRSTGASSAATGPRCCARSPPTTAALYRQADGDRLAGYLFARGNVLGPGAARDRRGRGRPRQRGADAGARPGQPDRAGRQRPPGDAPRARPARTQAPHPHALRRTAAARRAAAAGSADELRRGVAVAAQGPRPS